MSVKLVISTPKGYKRGNPVAGFPARLIDDETGKVLPGVGEINVRLPVAGCVTVTAEISVSKIEVVEEDPKATQEQSATKETKPAAGAA